MMFQDNNGKVLKESFGFQLKVKMVAFACSSENEQEKIIKPAYDEKVQLFLRKQYNSVVNPDLYEENKQKTKLYEQKRAVRDKGEDRLEQKRAHDKIRDKEEPRLEQKRKHDRIRDEVRDKEEPRLEQKRKHDRIRDVVRDKEEPRLEQKRKLDRKKEAGGGQ